MEDIRNICFQLNIVFDELGGDTKTGKIRELFLHMSKNKRLDELYKTIFEMRPFLKRLTPHNKQ